MNLIFIIKNKIRDYSQLIKLRLTLLVVFSAVSSYYLVSETINWNTLIYLALGGFCITGAANGFNEIMERELDKLMNRTIIRPIPDGRMNVPEAMIVCCLFICAGVFIMLHYTNLLCLLICLLSFFLYVFVYTPMKIHSPMAVFIGAFPGAMPVLIGATAGTSTGGLTFLFAWLLFGIQFIWQFPHFWSIAWVLDEDYARAGFRLLPSIKGRDKISARQIVIYTITLFPITLLPVLFGYAGAITAITVLIAGIIFIVKAWKLYKTLSTVEARQVMYWSFAYLPMVLTGMILDKIIVSSN